jgi:hypothetical protein
MIILALLVAACMNIGGVIPDPPTVPEASPRALANVCGTDRSSHANLHQSSSPQLRKLAEYEKVCSGAFADKVMFFARMPETADEALPLATQMATSLKEFEKHSVSPLVIFEPIAEDGTVLKIEDFQKGRYDAALAAYFQALRDEGITNKTMGMWVPFPEANAPMWHTTDAKDFVANVNLVVGLQKQYFPDSKASIMLNSQSYPSHDDAWQHGQYKSLLPFVEGIDEGLIDSFGYQGFPWLPPANDPTANDAITKPQEFLQSNLAEEAAKALGVTDIWLNTGTFGKAHAANEETLITMDPRARKQIMTDILVEAKKLTGKDLNVAIHLFAEDKSTVQEGIDWSYWRPGQSGESGSTVVFQMFMRDILLGGMSVWLYDDDHIRPLDSGLSAN